MNFCVWKKKRKRKKKQEKRKKTQEKTFLFLVRTKEATSLTFPFVILIVLMIPKIPKISFSVRSAFCLCSLITPTVLSYTQKCPAEPRFPKKRFPGSCQFWWRPFLCSLLLPASQNRLETWSQFPLQVPLRERSCGPAGDSGVCPSTDSLGKGSAGAAWAGVGCVCGSN